MLSVTPAVEETEHRRKRVRKGTKSCWECKRRKIKCQLSTEDVPVCSSCLQRGTKCLSQDYPEEHDRSNSAQVGERLGRVELLLERLLEKVNSHEKEKSLPTPESMTNNDVLTPNFSDGHNAYENAPILSLFDNVVIGRHDPPQESRPDAKGTTTPVCKPSSKLDRLRITIVSQFPSQRDSDLICHASSCWLLTHALMQTSASECFSGQDSTVSFNLAEVSKQHPTIAARTLLYIVVCMQQLPGDFDHTQLQLRSSIEATMEKYMATATLVTSDDELISTLEGLECLILQGVYHFKYALELLRANQAVDKTYNAGNLRRAWLTFRRALNVGQLMGLHRGIAQSVTGKAPEKSPGGTRMWYQFVHSDRYLALLLGMPCGTSDLPELKPEETFQNPEMDADQIFNRKLCNISGRIIERNQEDYSHAFTRTQEIDENLERLAKEMPPKWWILPEPAEMINDRSREAAQQFDRIMSQIWYFQIIALLHLPFMLRASTERRYEYSKFSCLNASRQMLDRYLVLRSSKRKSFCCKLVDFGAFTASVTLLLNLLEPPQSTETSITEQQQKQRDKHLVRTVVSSMSEIAQKGDVVAAQSVDVIQTLLGAVSDTTGRNSTNLRLSIPYFGTITISRAVPSGTSNAPVSVERRPLLPGQNIMGPQDWQALPFAPIDPNAPIVSFTSSQFNPFVQMDDWDLQEADTLFFDSLSNRDLDSSWNL